VLCTIAGSLLYIRCTQLNVMETPKVEDRKKLVELLLAAGTVVGIITAFLHIDNVAGEALFAVFIVLFVVGAIRIYTQLLMGETDTHAFRFLTGFTLVMFWGVLTGLIEIAVLAVIGNSNDGYVLGSYIVVWIGVALISWNWAFVGVYKVLTGHGWLDSLSESKPGK
jgi:hypothetical protein